MTLSISFPMEIEAKLRERATATGKDVATLVREAVEEKLSGGKGATIPADMPYELWLAAFDVWVAGHKPVGHFVDDSRESIYAGRDE